MENNLLSKYNFVQSWANQFDYFIGHDSSFCLNLFIYAFTVHRKGLSLCCWITPPATCGVQNTVDARVRSILIITKSRAMFVTIGVKYILNFYRIGKIGCGKVMKSHTIS